MKIHKFNKYERVAGLFVVTTVGGILLTALSVAVKQGWFETKVYYSTSFTTAEGIHPGTVVQMAGLRAGAVDDVDLQPDNSIRVNFYVLGKFQERIKEDSSTQLIRPFIIGDRVLDVAVGSETSPNLAQRGFMPSHETMDIMTLLSGKSLSTHLEKVSTTLDNLSQMLSALTSKDRTESLVRIFDRLDPLLSNVDAMTQELTKLSKQVTYKGNMQNVISNLAITTQELNHILPELNRENPHLAKDLGDMTKNLSALIQDFKVLGPAITAIGPELPQTAKKTVEALNETLIMMKAMQKSILIRGNIKEVREEEAAKERKPAAASDK